MLNSHLSRHISNLSLKFINLLQKQTLTWTQKFLESKAEKSNKSWKQIKQSNKKIIIPNKQPNQTNQNKPKKHVLNPLARKG